MAVNCSCSTQIPNQKYGSFLKYPNKKLMSKLNFVPLKKTSILRSRITASIKNKVYEDHSQGIVCYQDEHGEIICEGYDEGPCFQRISKPTFHPIPRDAEEITNILLRQSWLQIVKGGGGGEELSDPVEGVTLQEDLNCNGFNSLC